MSRSSFFRRAAAAGAAVSLGTAGALLAAQPAFAAPFLVENLDDSGDGSLRAAIEAANAAPGPDTISFDAGLDGTITLESTIAIDDALTITGPGADVITITRDGSFDLFEAFGITGDLAVSGLTFTGGVEDEGRAFAVEGVDGSGNVSFSDSVFTGLSAEGDGGAIYVSEIAGDVSFTGLELGSNVAGANGGAISIGEGENIGIVGDAIFDRILLEDNEADTSGGAVSIGNVEGSATVTFVRASRNVADSLYGGGFRFYSVDGNTTITDSTFDENESPSEGGGIQFETVNGVVRLDRVQFIGNVSGVGGGLWLHETNIDAGADPAESITIAHSQFTANSAVEGAGIGRSGGEGEGLQVTVDSSSFWGNIASVVGGEGPERPIAISILTGGLDDGESFRVVNSTFMEASDVEPSPYVIVADVGDESVVEVLHSTIVGPGGVLAVGQGEGDDGAVLVSHTIIESNTDDDALEYAFVEPPALVGDEVQRAPIEGDALLRGAGPLPSAGGSIRSGSASLAGPILPGGIFTLEWSLLSTGVDAAFVVQGAGNQLNSDPQLGALGSNGGLTPTMVPNAGSPAINTGDPAVSGAPATDQRGAARIVYIVDIGAVETPTGRTLPSTGVQFDNGSISLAAIAVLLGALALLLVRVRRQTV